MRPSVEAFFGRWIVTKSLIRHELLELEELDAHVRGALRGDERVVGDEAHAERERRAVRRARRRGRDRSTPSVLPESSTPSNFARSHLPEVSDAWACGRLRAWASSSAIACSAADRMLDCGALTTMTPALGRGLDIHVVEADPRAADHHEVAAGGEDLGGDLGRGADDQRCRADDGGRELLMAEPEPLIDLMARGAQRVDPRRGDLLGHQYSCHGAPSGGATRLGWRSGALDQPCAANCASRVRPSSRSSSEMAHREPEVPGAREGLPGHDGDHRGLQEVLGELGRGRRTRPPRGRPRRPGHVGEAVEGTLGQPAADALDLVEQLGHGHAAPVEGSAHLVCRREVAGDRRERRMPGRRSRCWTSSGSGGCRRRAMTSAGAASQPTRQPVIA